MDPPPPYELLTLPPLALGMCASAVLRSTVPPITSTAWPSMMTGLNPGKHGIYDFRALAADRYTRLWGAGHSAAFAEGREFATSRHWAGSAFWGRCTSLDFVALW